MAFCTNCGASVEGAFCSQCGKPVGQTSTPTASPAAPRRKTSVFVWILVVFLGLCLVGGLATVAGGLWLAHKVKEAGVDPELFRENPGLAISRLVNAAHLDADVLNTDPSSGTVTLRDRRTGKQVTLSFDDVKKGNIHFEAEDENGKRAVVDLGGDPDKVPANVPLYPGAKVQGTFEVDGDGAKGQGAFEYEFATSDAPDKVMAYYGRQLEDAGMKMTLHTHTADGGMLVAEDEANHRTLRVIVSKEAGRTTINVTARMKKP